MNTRFKSNVFLKVWLSLFLVFILSVGVSLKLGFRFNVSPSIATGIYQTTTNDVAHGQYINVCVRSLSLMDIAFKQNFLTRSLLCPNNEPSMMKRIAAITGDLVSINYTGVWINGSLEPNSRQVANFLIKNRHYILPNFANYYLGKNEVLLMSDNQKYGFDSRYYGVINLTKDISKFEVIKPVWVFN